MGKWVRVFAGHYRRIGSDGVTKLAEIVQGDHGWDVTVFPKGEPAWSCERRGYSTLRDAKVIAETLYRNRVRKVEAGDPCGE